VKGINPLPPISLFPAQQTHIPDDLPSHEEGGGDLKLKKNYNWKFLFLTIRREHPALQNMKILYFFLFFFPPQSGSAI
jgi:hypothetical protein